MPRTPKSVQEAAPACPICGRPADPATKPFCSVRCKNVDLNRWLGGVYRIETEERPNSENMPEEKDED
jgi:endogenous inhibitor of DNA gyrase (YacG/DUF329 family)